MPPTHLPSIPSPSPDQTSGDFANWTALVGAFVNRRRATEALFGSANIDPSRPFHGGFEHFQGVLERNGHTLRRSAVEEFSFAAIYRPFLSAERFARAVSEVQAIQIPTLGIAARKSSLFKTKPSYCPACMLEAFERRGVAPLLRTHQVRGVMVCHVHATTLIDSCSTCGSAFSKLSPALPSCWNCGQEHRLHCDARVPRRPKAWFQFARAVWSALSGVIPAALSADWYVDRTRASIGSRSGDIGANLARHLSVQFGEEFFQHAGYSPDTAPTLGWPALFVGGSLPSGDPLPGLMLIAALSDESEWPSIPTESTPTGRLEFLGPNQDIATEMSLSILKDIYRERSITAVAAKHAILKGRLKRWVASYPGLQSRVASFKIRLARVAIRRALRLSPGASRSAIELRYPDTFARLARADREWLDLHLPSSKPGRLRALSDHAPSS